MRISGVAAVNPAAAGIRRFIRTTIASGGDRYCTQDRSPIHRAAFGQQRPRRYNLHSLEQAALFLVASVLLVPLFRRLGLGAVLGYLCAGMLIGPWGFALIGEVQATLQFAEFGVVLLLFLVGLELQPSRLWLLRRPVFGLGGAQVALSAAILAAVGLGLGLSWRAALVAGLALAMSSTALVLAALAERRQLGARHGRDAFAVLLFQDLAVIPLLALLPLLAEAPADGGSLGWVPAIKGLLAIATVVTGSRLVVRPALKFIARHGGREMFTAAALLLVIGAALAMESIGLSMSLGAFLAGVLLADSEFRHELEADIEPFKGLLLGLFFIAVGMSANLDLLWARPLLVAGLALGLMTLKYLAVLLISRVARAEFDPAQRLAVALAQGGEFAFVLFSAASPAVLAPQTAQLLVLVVTLSMLLSPPLIELHGRWLARWSARHATPEFDTIDSPANPVIIAGFGRMGQIVSRVLRMCDLPFTALEASYQQVDFVRRYGSNKVYYGDASRLELLEAAKVGEARLFVLAIDDVEASVKTAAVVRRHFPDLPIVARARNRVHVHRLRDLGVGVIYRETFRTSLDMAHQALLRLGFGVAAAGRAVALFRQHDEEQLDTQYAIHHDEAQLMQSAKEAAEQLRELFESDAIGAMAALRKPQPRA